jgi:alanine racemase
MSLKTHITAIKRVPAGTSLSYGRTYFTDKETNIITLPIGYADGLNIKLSGVLKVGIRDKKYTISGRISMDQTMVDIGDDSYPVGEEVVIYDREENTISNIAKLLNTIPYEVMCWISARVERRYIKKDLMKNNLEKYYMTYKSKSI